ncbi:FAD-dependent oxidoreductase (plasmid) [Sphingopyxis indica]|uniref:NAD(P)/FAD-dependent oxidoreductase n=1 Tax=Sphingopyxis indica TaxID=436663 RepID=UPI002939328F|nr:FAD-dependent oxidoreductase [Sphingopyxis indica]WOF45882.1 FAD-dependent oxidoreductase [Sphingopyxis indica]
MRNDVYVIVGAGQAGGWIVKTLRAEGFDGKIVLIGAERHPPYERPPLSKNLLRDAEAITETALLSLDDLSDAEVEVYLGEKVRRIDRARQTVECSGGQEMRYDRLFLTTGSQPRIPEWAAGINSDRVHLLRTIDDAATLRNVLPDTSRLLIVGGGWIGLEVAASARSLGVPVTILESAPRLCQRSVPEAVSTWLKNLHERHGVEFLFGRTATALTARPDGVELILDDGSSITADRLLACIGAAPDMALAERAGLEVSNGIVVDQSGRTSDPRIFAAGDVTNFPCRYAGRATRRESWANAQNQAIVAAKAALGHELSYCDLPWLWSDQYAHNIQIAGFPEQAAQVLFRSGPSDESGCWLCLDEDGQAIGGVGVDTPKLFRPVLKTLKARTALDDAEWSTAPRAHGAAA